MPFLIIALQSGVTRISLEGTLDLSTIEGLRQELQAIARRSATHVELELSGLRSISPRGVAVLLSFLDTIARAGCRVTVTGLRDQPHDTFKSALATAIAGAAPPLN